MSSNSRRCSRKCVTKCSSIVVYVMVASTRMSSGIRTGRKSRECWCNSLHACLRVVLASAERNTRWWLIDVVLALFALGSEPRRGMWRRSTVDKICESERMSAMLRVARVETSAPVRRYQRRTSIKSVTVSRPTNWHVAGSHRGAACISLEWMI